MTIFKACRTTSIILLLLTSRLTRKATTSMASPAMSRWTFHITWEMTPQFGSTVHNNSSTTRGHQMIRRSSYCPSTSKGRHINCGNGYKRYTKMRVLQLLGRCLKKRSSCGLALSSLRTTTRPGRIFAKMVHYVNTKWSLGK